MFHTLLASGPQPRPGAPRFLLSAGFHGMAIAGAIVLTRQASIHPAAPRLQPDLLFVAPQEPRPSMPMGRPPTAPPVAPALPSEPDLPVPDLTLSMVPTALPSVVDLLREASIRSGSPALPTSGGGLGGAPSPEPWTADSVDDPVAVIDQHPVPYPPLLAQAGITGRVDLEYVVDTLGRVEPGSLRALTSTRPEFEAAARAGVLGSRYRPARAGGRAVRQLVHQTLRFRSDR